MSTCARIVLEVPHQAACQVFPTIIQMAAAGIKDQFQQMSPLPFRYLLLRLKKQNRCLVPGMQEPESIKRMRRIRSVVNKQACQLPQIKQRTLKLIDIDVTTRQSSIGIVEQPSLLALQRQSTRNALRNMMRGIPA